MKLFSKRERSTFNDQKFKPAIRSSICTGEKVAGFLDRQNGHFSEVMLIRSEKDIESFRKQFGISGEIVEFY